MFAGAALLGIDDESETKQQRTNIFFFSLFGAVQLKASALLTTCFGPVKLTPLLLRMGKTPKAATPGGHGRRRRR